MFFRIVVLCLSMFFAISAFGGPLASSSDPILSRYAVSPETEFAMNEIAKKFEVTKRLPDGTFEIILPANRVRELLQLDPDANQVEADISEVFRRAEKASPGILNTFYNYESVEDEVKKIAEKYPSIAKYEVYGKSKQGRNLFVLKISDNVATDENEPELMVTGATHGNEIEGTEVVMKAINALIANYGKDQRLTKMVNEHELFFVPTLNADGYASYTRYDNGVDPNREYAWPEQPNYVPKAASIKAIVSFFHAHNFVGTMDLHSSGGLVMYPWAYTHTSVPDADRKVFETIGHKMADPVGYEVGPIADIIYIAPGSSADYFYWKKHTLGFGIELNGSFAMGKDALEEEVDSTVEMTWQFIESF